MGTKLSRAEQSRRQSAEAVALVQKTRADAESALTLHYQAAYDEALADIRKNINSYAEKWHKKIDGEAEWGATKASLIIGSREYFCDSEFSREERARDEAELAVAKEFLANEGYIVKEDRHWWRPQRNAGSSYEHYQIGLIVLWRVS